MITFNDQLKSLSNSYPCLVQGLEMLTTLEQLFEWVRAGGDTYGQIDLIAQDEFSHDLVLECPKDRLYLCFGST